MHSWVIAHQQWFEFTRYAISLTIVNNYVLLCHHHPKENISITQKFLPGPFLFITHLPKPETTILWFLSPWLVFTADGLHKNWIHSIHSLVQKLFCSIHHFKDSSMFSYHFFFLLLSIHCVHGVDMLQSAFPFSHWWILGYFCNLELLWVRLLWTLLYKSLWT